MDVFVGNGPAAEYLGIKRRTLTAYIARGVGPTPRDDRQPEGQYLLPVYDRAELDRWRDSRPGRGARTDLKPASA